MKRLRQNKIVKIVWIVMALHILNFSLDAPDAHDDTVAEDISYNEIESLTEWFAEEVMNIENAFAESDELGDENSGFIKKVLDIKFYHLSFESHNKFTSPSAIKNSNTNSKYSVSICTTIYISIFSPPPEA